MILGLTGVAQSGKDTAAKYLIKNYGFERRAFADKLKDFAYAINPELREAVDAVGWEHAKRIPIYRRFLQDLGHEARNHFGENFWIDQVLEACEEGYSENIVITDMRYPNEFARVNWLEGWTVRITRPGIGPVNNHATEIQHLQIPVAFEALNDTLDNLYKQLDDIIWEIKSYD